MEKIVARGAEAILIYKDKDLIKRRISKGYRLKEIDSKLIKTRTRQEIRLLKKLEGIIPVPKIIGASKNEITMDFIKGYKLSDHLDNFSETKRKKICKLIGKQVAKMHDLNVIHGDLTTSNMILKDDQVYFIDFGLGFVNEHIEHKAVDLHLINQALESKHYRHYKECFKNLLEGYKSSKCSGEVLERLEKVKSRGRYKKRK